MTFKRTFTPAILAFFVDNLDEQPSRKDTEIFDALDLNHDVDFSGGLRGELGIRKLLVSSMIRRRCTLLEDRMRADRSRYK
jgi:hypothetical protein